MPSSLSYQKLTQPNRLRFNPRRRSLWWQNQIKSERPSLRRKNQSLFWCNPFNNQSNRLQNLRAKRRSSNLRRQPFYQALRHQKTSPPFLRKRFKKNRSQRETTYQRRDRPRSLFSPGERFERNSLYCLKAVPSRSTYRRRRREHRRRIDHCRRRRREHFRRRRR